LNEYLATGRPVVSSPIETAREFNDIVAIANTDEEFKAAIEQGLTEAAHGTAMVRARQRFARANDWDALVARIADLLSPGRARARQAERRR
jgi:glycosyltransferase involved in cell wall biosynthesis